MNPEDDNLNNSEPEASKENLPERQNDLPEEKQPSAEQEGELRDAEADEGEILHRPSLLRSQSDRIFLGVCGGLGNYFDAEPLFFRLAFILSIIFGFWGILFYLILGIIMPEEKDTPVQEENGRDLKNENHKILIGSSLILLGVFLMVKDTRLFRFLQVWNILADYMVPAALIISGLFLIFTHRNLSQFSDKKLYRSTENKKIAGVCSGLAEYLNVDPTIIRILWLIFVFSSFGIGLLIYILFIIVVPEKREIVNEDRSEYN